MHCELPLFLASAISQELLANMIISNLPKNDSLKAIHTIMRSKYSDQSASVTFQYIEEQVTAVLKDLRSDPVPAIDSNEDEVASVATYCTEQETRPSQLPNCENFLLRSPFSRKESQPQKIPPTVWELMSHKARDACITNKGQQRQHQR